MSGGNEGEDDYGALEVTDHPLMDCNGAPSRRAWRSESDDDEDLRLLEQERERNALVSEAPAGTKLAAPTSAAVTVQDTVAAAADAAARAEKRKGSRRVSFGWLQEQGDDLKISLAGLVAAVAFNPEKNEGVCMEDKVWFKTYVRKVAVSFLGLTEDEASGIFPLGTLDSDPKPLAAVWKERVAEEDLERAFGELFAQSILEIGERARDPGQRYDSRTHYCLTRVANKLGITHECFEEYEGMIAGLVAVAAVSNERAQLTDEEKSEQSRKRVMRNFKVGAAAVLGATLVGVTGGLALPAIGASLATFGGAAATTGAFMASAGGTALFTTLFSAGGLGLTGYKMNRRIGSKLTEFEFAEVENSETGEPFPNGLHVCICVPGTGRVRPAASMRKPRSRASRGSSASSEVNGKANTEAETTDTKSVETRTTKVMTEEGWSACATRNRAMLGQPFELVWESECRKDVKTALQSFAINQAVSTAVKETLKTTTFAAVMAAVAWPSMVLSAANFIDNAWVVAVNRAKVAGEELARAIISGAHGHRPVTLVGTSIGGLVVFSCLEYLAKKKRSRMSSANVEGLVLNAIIMGAPITASVDRWREVRSVVDGALVNGYAPNDWMLAILFRASVVSVARIAGLYCVDCPGVVNVDLAEAGLIWHQLDYDNYVNSCVSHVMEVLEARETE